MFACERFPDGSFVNIDGGEFCEPPDHGDGKEASIFSVDNAMFDRGAWTPTGSVWRAPPAELDVTTDDESRAVTRVSAIVAQILMVPDIVIPAGKTLRVFASRPGGGKRAPEDSCAAVEAKIGPGVRVLDEMENPVPCPQGDECDGPLQTCSVDFKTHAPICRWIDDSRWKYVVAHELGHQYQISTFGFFGTEADSKDAYTFSCPPGDSECSDTKMAGTQAVGPNSDGEVRLYDPFLVDPLCRCDHVEISNRLHCAQSIERSGDAQTEGFGQFFASMVWNRQDDISGPSFQYYKEFLDADCHALSGHCKLSSGLLLSRPPVAFNPYDKQMWRDRHCPMQPPDVDKELLQPLQTFGTEIDWLGFYYSLIRAQDPADRLPIRTFHDIYRAACSSVADRGNVTLLPSGLRDCSRDPVAWTDAIVNPMPGINDGLTAGVRDSAERLFDMDGIGLLRREPISDGWTTLVGSTASTPDKQMWRDRHCAFSGAGPESVVTAGYSGGCGGTGKRHDAWRRLQHMVGPVSQCCQ